MGILKLVRQNRHNNDRIRSLGRNFLSEDRCIVAPSVISHNFYRSNRGHFSRKRFHSMLDHHLMYLEHFFRAVSQIFFA